MALLLAATVASAPASAMAGEPDSVPGELIVRYHPGVGGGEKAEVREQADVQVDRPMLLDRAQVLEVEGGQSVGGAIRELNRDPAVDYAEPNFLYEPLFTPDDTRFAEQWGLHNTGQLANGVIGSADSDIDAPEAWDTTTGDPGVTVAIVDTGVEVDHPDLDDRIWQNPGESGAGKETNGLDDDANSFGSRSLVDDFQGWDFFDDDNDPSPGTEFRGDHGTHVAGIVGAEGDNSLGVTGVSQNVGLMALRAGDADGLPNSDTTDAFIYAAAEGADIVNGSFGSIGVGSFSHRAVIDANPDILFVFAAGNDDNDNDVNAHYPSNHGADGAANVIAVAATTSTDARASFSNYGSTTVDLGAPGKDILNTITNGTYGFKQGTSMASPMVAGAAALVKAAHPASTVAQLEDLLVDGTDLVPSMIGKTVSGGRLNVNSSIEIPGDATAPTSFLVTAPAQGAHVNDATPLLDWDASSDADSGLREYELLIRVSGEPSYTLDRDEIPPGTTAIEPAAALQDGETYDWFVRARDKAGNIRTSTFARSFTVDTTAPTPFAYVAPADGLNTQGPGNVTFDWTNSSDANLDEYELYVDGSLRVDGINPASSQATFDLSLLPEGQHAWFVRARDEAGNNRIVTDSPRFFRIDRTAPTAPVRADPADEEWVDTSSPEFSWQASTDFGGSGINKYTLSLGGPANQIKVVAPGTLSAQFDNPIPDGEHPWSVIVEDNAGNINFTGTPPGGYQIRVDTVAPDAFTLDAPADGETFTEPADPQFSWNGSADATSGLAEYELTIDGAVARDAIDPGDTATTAAAAPAVGDHVWTVRAVDVAGNETTATERSFTVEAAAPPPPPPNDAPPPGDPPPGDPPPADDVPNADTDAPEFVGEVIVDPKRFAVGKQPTPRQSPRGTEIAYELSEAAAVELAIERKTRGLELEDGDECVAETKRSKRKLVRQIRERLGDRARGPKGKRRIRKAVRRARCRLFAERGVLEREAAQGRNEEPFSGRIGKRKQPPGRYRVVVRATDAAGNESEPATAGFRIVGKKKR